MTTAAKTYTSPDYTTGSQIDRVLCFMVDHKATPFTLAEIAEVCGIDNPGSVASRLRDLRTMGWIINKDQAVKGTHLFLYTFMGFDPSKGL